MRHSKSNHRGIDHVSVDLSFFSLILNASLVVQLVMLLLVFLSVVSWSLIYRKYRTLTAAREHVARLRDDESASERLEALVTEFRSRKRYPSRIPVKSSGRIIFVRRGKTPFLRSPGRLG